MAGRRDARPKSGLPDMKMMWLGTWDTIGWDDWVLSRLGDRTGKMGEGCLEVNVRHQIFLVFVLLVDEQMNMGTFGWENRVLSVLSSTKISKENICYILPLLTAAPLSSQHHSLQLHPDKTTLGHLIRATCLPSFHPPPTLFVLCSPPPPPHTPRASCPPYCYHSSVSPTGQDTDRTTQGLLLWTWRGRWDRWVVDGRTRRERKREKTRISLLTLELCSLGRGGSRSTWRLARLSERPWHHTRLGGTACWYPSSSHSSCMSLILVVWRFISVVWRLKLVVRRLILVVWLSYHLCDVISLPQLFSPLYSIFSYCLHSFDHVISTWYLNSKFKVSFIVSWK